MTAHLRSNVFHFLMIMCYNLVGITIPDSVTKIGDDIFNNCNAVMEVGHDSYAEQYAIDNGIRYIYPEFWME